MLSPIYFPSITYGLILKGKFCNCACGTQNYLINWLAFGKLPENPVITPNTTTQVVRPSSVNRFLQTVTVEAIPTTTAPGA